MSTILELDDVARACTESAAEALKVDSSRITTDVSVNERGEIVVDWKLDGNVPTDEQINTIANFIENLMRN